MAKVRVNSKKVVIHPRRTARRERALALRVEQLKRYEDAHAILTGPPNDVDHEVWTTANKVRERTSHGLLSRAIKMAKLDIANAKKRLNVQETYQLMA